MINFSDQEIFKAGSDPKKLDENQCNTLDLFASMLKEDYNKKIYVVLLFNGLTSGDHASPEHKEGKATDFIIVNKSGKHLDAKKVCHYMALAGFRGIGAYYNGLAWSFHGDTGDRIRSWFWDKRDKNKIKKLSLFNTFLSGAI